MIVLGSQMLRGYKTPQLPETMKKTRAKIQPVGFLIEKMGRLYFEWSSFLSNLGWKIKSQNSIESWDSSSF